MRVIKRQTFSTMLAAWKHAKARGSKRQPVRLSLHLWVLK